MPPACWVQMAELQRQLGLDMGAALEEYQETQQVLFPVALVSAVGLACWEGGFSQRTEQVCAVPYCRSEVIMHCLTESRHTHSVQASWFC